MRDAFGYCTPVMPAPFAIVVGFMIGASLAWLARTELARSEVPLVLARPFLVALSFGGLVFAPVVAYFIAFHGDWSYLYLFRCRRVPSAVDLTLVLLATLQLPIGFAVAAPFARSKRRGHVAALLGIMAGLIIVGFAVFGRQLLTSASYVQFHGGFGAIPIGRSALGRAVLLAWIALAGAYAWAAHVLRSART